MPLKDKEEYNSYAKAYYHKNSEKRKAQRKAYYHSNKEEEAHRARLRNYGLTKEAFLQMIDEQQSKCAICSFEINLKAKDLNVDHCHETGNVRGLLCRDCNLMLGYAKDNPEVLNKASEYLQAAYEVG